MLQRVGKIKAEVWLSLGLILIIAILAFLPLVGQLGYYHDDWFTTISRVSGVSLIDMHAVDRPGMGYLYQITSKILGESPLAWHLYAWLVRFLGGLALLWLLRLLWPQQRTATTFMVLLYVVYPGFLQQPSANNYQNHMMAYSGSILSMALTVWAIKTPQIPKKILASIGALVIGFYYPRVYEAMIGIEGLRLVIIFMVFYQTLTQNIKLALKKSLLWFSPYLINGLVFVVWRLFIFSSARVTIDAAALLAGYRANPLEMGLRTIVTLLQDVFETVLAAWVVPFYQLSLTTTSGYYFLALSIGVIAFLAVLIISKRLNKLQSQETSSNQWIKEALLIGITGTFLTLIPVALSGRDVQFRIFLDRYTYQSIVPVAILLVGIIYWSARSISRTWIMAGLVFLAVMVHILNAAQYSQNWNMQKKVWWELSWRAPQISPGTLLVVQMPPGYKYPEGAEIWAIANRIYYPDQNGPVLTAEVLNNETLNFIHAGQPIDRNYRWITYVQDFSSVLVLSLPSENSCLHVINGEQPLYSPWEEEFTRKAAAVSDINLIMTDVGLSEPPRIIFGREPEHGWCYYYQQASLAMQMGDWERVRQLEAQAERQGLQPDDPVELIPFIEAKLQLNNEVHAVEKDMEILEKFPGFWEDLCQYYQDVRQDKTAEQVIKMYCAP